MTKMMSALTIQPRVRALAALGRPALILQFWREAGPDMWFAKDPAFDTLFRETFAEDYANAAAGRCPAWTRSPEGALALILLLDQYPRNSFRGTPQMYATDAMARAEAADAIWSGYDLRIDPDIRLFFYLPFAHSEDIADHDRLADLVAHMGDAPVARAAFYHGIISRFGRFPHRNDILGRPSTPEEIEWLANGGYQG
jgi:uncharacterized protein (DUF924 family)